MINRLLVIFYILIGFSTQAIAQVSINPKGTYFGGTADGFGYYYIKNDSSFYFFGTLAGKRKWNNQPEKDTIISVGKGKWNIVNGFFNTKFNNTNIVPLVNSKIIYKSFTATPYDSLRLNITVKNKYIKNQSVLFLLGEKKQRSFALSDKNGNFNLIYPIEFLNDTVEIDNPGYKKHFQLLNKEHNVHEIELYLDSLPIRLFSIIPEMNIPYSLFKNNDSLFRDRRFISVSGGDKLLKKLIDNNVEIYPMQKALLKKLEEEMFNE